MSYGPRRAPGGRDIRRGAAYPRGQPNGPAKKAPGTIVTRGPGLKVFNRLEEGSYVGRVSQAGSKTRSLNASRGLRCFSDEPVAEIVQCTEPTFM
jgi:hypothetical protein